MGIMKSIEKYKTIDVITAMRSVTNWDVRDITHARRMSVRKILNNLPKCDLLAIEAHLKKIRPLVK